MQNAGLDEAQTGIKIAGRNINNLRYTEDTTLMVEREEELKNLLMKLKEESEKAGLKLSINKTKIMTSGPIHFSSVQLLSRVRLFATPKSQHARSPCPSPTPGVHSDSCPSSQ